MAASRNSSSIRVHAHAKLNLTLRVLGTRPDGYHELRTVFQSLALHDTLVVIPRPGPFGIDCDNADCPRDSSNLVWQAAERLWRDAGKRGPLSGYRVRITKRIPIQAGLGGGSSDAAAMLSALATAWGTTAGVGQLAAIGGELGADVPFFFTGGTALGLERGDLIFPLPDCQPSWVVLVQPSFGVSTRDAYGWWDARAQTARPNRHRSSTRAQISGLRLPAAELVNDLEAPVAARHAAIGRLVRDLRRAGAVYAAMSGSGSAVFGLFETEQQAILAKTAFSRPDLQVWVTRTIGRKAYQRASAPRLF